MDEQYKTIVKAECPHSGTELKVLSSGKKACQACGEAEHLRICTECGKVFCCESSQGHNTKHWKKTGHAVIKTIHCPYDFTWCYACKAYLV